MPIRRLCHLALLLAVAASDSAGGGTAAGANIASKRRGVSRFTHAELQVLAHATRTRLRRVLRAEGAVLVTEIPGYSGATGDALDSLSDCFRRLKAAAADGRNSMTTLRGHPVTSPALLRRGVERWTLASATMAGTPQPLPDWATTACPDLIRPTQKLRSFIGLLLVSFAHSVDLAVAPADIEPAEVSAESQNPVSVPFRRLVGGAPPSRLATQAPAPAQVQRAALEELVRQGTLLEHFHRYVRADTAGTEAVVAGHTRPIEMHTDAGLLQALAVRWRSVEGAEDKEGVVGVAALEVELPGGLVVAAEEEAAGMSPPARGAGSDGAHAGGLLLLLGQASQEWLPRLHLRAAPHALAASTAVGSDRRGRGAERLVYGIMVLPPQDWSIALPGAPGNTTFGEWWRRAQQAVIGGSIRLAATSASRDEDSHGCLSTSLLRRQLQDQAETCPAGSIYCWMQCQKVPSSLPCRPDRAVCKSSTTGKICPEDTDHDPSCKPACPAPGSNATFEVLDAGERELNGGYRIQGMSGGKNAYVKPPAMIGAIRAQVAWDDYWESENFGRWVFFAPGYKGGSALYYSDSDSDVPPRTGWVVASGLSPAPTLNYSNPGGNSPHQPVRGYCSGALTDMHMLGFVWTGADNPCLIFFFRGFELTSATKFWGAAAITVVMGAIAEFLVALRRWESRLALPPRAPGARCNRRRTVRNGMRLVLYAVTRTIGYMVMLVTMTYSYELFIAVVVGLTLGHAIFNLSSSPGEDTTACCQASDSVLGRCEVRRPEARIAPLNGEHRLRFEVTGMRCESCCGTVQRAVESLGPAYTVMELTLATGILEVAVVFGSFAGSSSSDADDVCRAIRGVGFDAQLLASAAAAVAPTARGRTSAQDASTSGAWATASVAARDQA